MDTIGKRIKKATNFLKSGELMTFVREMEHALYAMVMLRMVSYKTVHEIDEIFHRCFMTLSVKYMGDSVYTTYLEGIPVVSFAAQDVISWIEHCLEVDDVYRNREEKTDLEYVVIPFSIEEVYRNVLIGQKDAIHIDGTIYCTTDEFDSRCHLKKVTDDKKELIFWGVEPRIMYSEEARCIYCNIEEIDAYLRYHLDTGEKEIIYQLVLIGVDNDGAEWFRDRQKVLYSCLNGKIRAYGNVPDKCDLRINPNGIRIAPTLLWKDQFLPYVLHVNGERTQCIIEEAGEWLWELIVRSITLKDDEEYEESVFPWFLYEEKLRYCPKSFTAKDMIEKIEGLPGVRDFKAAPLISLIQKCDEKHLVEELYYNWQNLFYNGDWPKVYEEGLIGAFTEKDGKIITHFDKVKNGRIEGNRVVFDSNRGYEGEIYFDREDYTYVMKWNGEREFHGREYLSQLIGGYEVWEEVSR